jgi:hypothetical protein
MSFHRDHHHTTNMKSQFRSGNSRQSYAAVVGTVEQSTERPITGRSGDHLQFYIDVGGGARYQVDINTQSNDGSDVDVYIADQGLTPQGENPDEPFGAPAYGVFPDAQLSYAGIGLNNQDFTPLSFDRIDSQLRAALNMAQFVSVYGMTFDDGGNNGKGVHDTHLNPGKQNQDGAIVIYYTDSGSGKPQRTWFFFKFGNENVGQAGHH